MNKFIEEYLFNPKTFFQKFLSFLLLPFTFIYCLIVFIKFPKKLKEMGIPIISIGNIIIGGTGKTPFTISLANRFKNGAVVLRGYGRESKGIMLISEKGKIIEKDVKKSGDEAMEIALSTKATVIVAENRGEGILKAKELGCSFVILDDGFDKPFKKLNIVIDFPIKNRFCIPSGGYRYSKYFLKYSDLILKEGEDFKRVVQIPNIENYILITAISKPERLFQFIQPKYYHFFMDHYQYKKSEIEEILNKYGVKTILTTKKDFVKLKEMGFHIKIIELNLEISERVINKIEEYLVKYD